MRLLARSSTRYLGAHRWQFALSVIGVALGVAVVVSVDLANASAARAFDLSSTAVTGRTTHQVVGGPGGVPESVFVELRAGAGVRRAAPVVDSYVTLPGGADATGFRPGRPLRLLGIDPFSEGLFRSDLGTGPLDIDLGEFLTTPGIVLMSAATAGDIGVGVGDELEVRVGTRRDRLTVGAILATGPGTAEESVADLLVSDISTAQEVLGVVGRLTRIDLIFDDDEPGAARQEEVRSLLPPGLRLISAAARTETTRQMTRAFRLNLMALSLLALVCGVFLVYNTMSFSVVQRRQLIGTLRAIGVTRWEIFGLTLAEAAGIGILGSLLGLVGGVAIGRLLVSLVTRTINDLYFVVAVRDLALSPWPLVKGGALGIVGAVLAALPAASEATGAPPRAVLVRSQLEARARRRALPAAAAGLTLLASGTALLALSGRSLLLSFAALFAIILGFALLSPAAVVLGMRLATRPMMTIFGPLGRIAARGVTASLSRTAVAIAALTVAVSVVVGVGVMIDSFRGTVDRWLGAVLVADLYVSPLSPGTAPPALDLDAETRARLAEIGGVTRVSSVRGLEVPTPEGGRTRVTVFDIDGRGEAGFQFAAGDPDEVWEAFRNEGAVMVTEPYAYRHDAYPGSAIELLTDTGPRMFTVAGVYYDYASEEGLVALDRSTYERYWNDRAVSALSIYVDDGADTSLIGERIRAAFSQQAVVVRSNRAIRQISLEVFDRTFLITGVLRTLVTLVAVVGVLSALMALQIERSREVGVLRALGLTPAEVWGLSTSQSALMGLVSGALALPVGMALAAIMIFVINRRSFGWTLEMETSPQILLQAFLLALIGAAVAGIYPAYRMSATPPATALREE